MGTRYDGFVQATKAELKTKTEALATNERQRGQYEAMAKAKQQVGICIGILAPAVFDQFS